MTDTLYQDPSRANRPFRFDSDVATVFDNMLNRSIPLYSTIQDMIQILVSEFAHDDSHIYDLGCSTGVTLCLIAPRVPNATCIGIDFSSEMLDQAEHRRFSTCSTTAIQWLKHDLNKPISLQPSSVIILNLCYQFIEPSLKKQLLDTCYHSLLPGGKLIIVEKILSTYAPESYQEYYESFKRQQGYTETEIQGKKQALKGVLHSITRETLIQDLTNSHFKSIEPFFQWFNFIGLTAEK